MKSAAAAIVEPGKGKELLEFVGARAASWALFETGFAALLKLMGISNIFNRLIVLVLVTVFNYVASKFWIFKGKTQQAQHVDGPAETGNAERRG